jgi:hypothetical protein
MSKKNDGGPINPIVASVTTHSGLTIRDWLAGQAMNGLIAKYGICSPSMLKEYDDYSASSFLMADAMLKERDK